MNNLCYFPLKCSWHQGTELSEKSKHLLKHSSLWVTPDFSVRKLPTCTQHCACCHRQSWYCCLRSCCHAEPPHSSPGHAMSVPCWLARTGREFSVQRKDTKSAFVHCIPPGLQNTVQTHSGAEQCLQKSDKQWSNTSQGQLWELQMASNSVFNLFLTSFIEGLYWERVQEDPH